MSDSNKNPFTYSYSIPNTWNNSLAGGSNTPPAGDNVSKSIPDTLDEIREMKKRLWIKEGKVIEKGLLSDDPDVIVKANAAWHDVMKKQDSGIKTVTVNPLEFKNSLGWKDRKATVSFEMLKRMAEIPMVRAVITTRQAQVSEFAKPQTNKFEPGWIIRKKAKYFSEEQDEVTPEDREKMHKYAKFILNCGVEENSWNADTFEMFLKKIVDDALTMDQASFEVVRNNFGEPHEYLATDGSTFRLASTFTQEEEYNLEDKEKVRGYLPKYVQVIDGVIENDYYPWELCLGIRNASTSIYSNGYGKSELENLVQIVTWMLYADQYNGNFFSQGASPKGFITNSKYTCTHLHHLWRDKCFSCRSSLQNHHLLGRGS